MRKVHDIEGGHVLVGTDGLEVFIEWTGFTSDRMIRFTLDQARDLHRSIQHVVSCAEDYNLLKQAAASSKGVSLNELSRT